MSTLDTIEQDAPAPWLVPRVVDWANPILVKELRQSLKSRQFVVTFMLLVTAAWLVSVFGLLMFQTQVQYGPAGRFFFIGFYIALAVATLLIVPFGTFKSLQSERDFNTFEILSVTTITPQQIVRGRLSSAFVQCLIYYSAITPFIAFASTMQGFDSPKAAYVLVITLMGSMMLSMAALMLSTLAKQRAAQGLFSVILIAQLIGAAIGGSSTVGLFIGTSTLSLASSEFWLVNAAGLMIWISYFILFQQIATANLTFESANHSTGIRITAMAQCWLLWLVAFIYCQWNGIKADSEMFFVFAMFSIVHWALFGLAFTAEPDSLSRRIRRGFPDNKPLRMLMVPFLPGGARGYLYVVLNIVAVWLLYAIGMSYFARGGWFGGGFIERVSTALTSQNRFFCVVTVFCLELIIYLGINAALARWGQAASEVIKPAHARVVTFLILMASIVGPQILYVSKVIDLGRGQYHFLQVLDPFNTARRLMRRPDETTKLILAVLALLAVMAILVNLVAISQGITRVLTSRVRPRKPSDIKPYSSEVGIS